MIKSLHFNSFPKPGLNYKIGERGARRTTRRRRTKATFNGFSYQQEKRAARSENPPRKRQRTQARGRPRPNAQQGSARSAIGPLACAGAAVGASQAAMSFSCYACKSIGGSASTEVTVDCWFIILSRDIVVEECSYRSLTSPVVMTT